MHSPIPMLVQAGRTLRWVSLFLTLAAGSAQAQVKRPERVQVGPAGRITGTVSGDDGAALERVRVDVLPQDGQAGKSAFTDASGRFVVSGLKPGKYDLRISRIGFRPQEISGLEAGEGALPPLVIRLQVAESPDRGRIGRPAERGGQPLPPPQPAAETATAYPPLRLRAGEPPAASPVPAGPLPAAEAEFRPLGHAGSPTTASAIAATADFVPVPDRWRIGLPRWDRYENLAHGVAPYSTGRPADPYNQNVLKGDYPLFGNSWFLNLKGSSDTLSEYRRLPVVGPPSAERPGEPDFFSKGDQFQFVELLEFSADLFQGYTAFKPFGLRFKVTPALSLNYLKVRETGLVNIDVREGTTRPDSHGSLEEAFAEVKLADAGPQFDFLSLRVGTQFFNSDFRGFIFFDNQPGIRLFGNFKANKHQYNLAYFYMLEKDTNSLLNTFDSRQQHVAVANYYIQDFIKLGYTTQFSVHYNNDRPSLHFNTNDFVVRPAPISNVTPKSINALYLGWAGDGHFGTLNISHAFYQVLGRERPNQIAGDFLGARDTDINAQMAALELSVDRDWRRYRGSFYYASGDGDPFDGKARGFDSIVDNAFFAGGGLSLWDRQEIRLTGTAVGLVHRISLNPNLRSSKEEGQANFVNPGILIFNAGIDAELTPKLRGSANLNFLSFAHTEVLEALLFQSDIDRFIGADLGMGVEYRPWLNENVRIGAGASVLIPGGGFRDVFTSKSLLSTFVEVRLTY